MKIQQEFPGSHSNLSNAYLYGQEGGEAFLIDCGFSSAEPVLRHLEKHGMRLKGILLTHGHYDHIRGIDAISEATGAKIYIHPSDAVCLSDSRLSSAILFGTEFSSKQEPLTFQDGDVLKAGEISLRVIHTPFHSEGSCCFLDEEAKLLFSGDTLFRFSIGRTDLAGSQARYVSQSLEKLRALDPSTKVLPGHGRATSITAEEAYNPYFDR